MAPHLSRAKLANQTWTLGKDADLKSDGKGNWSFAPVVDLRPGTYDVTVEASDQAGNISRSVLAAAIVIPEQPAAPAIPIPAPTCSQCNGANACLLHHYGSPALPCGNLV